MLAATTDKLMGLCLVYDMAAIALGQHHFKLDPSGMWPRIIAISAVFAIRQNLDANRENFRGGVPL